MEIAIGPELPLMLMTVLTTTSTDPETIAAVDAFNGYFSLVMEFGLLAFLFTSVTSSMSRS